MVLAHSLATSHNLRVRTLSRFRSDRRLSGTTTRIRTIDVSRKRIKSSFMRLEQVQSRSWALLMPIEPRTLHFSRILHQTVEALQFIPFFRQCRYTWLRNGTGRLGYDRSQRLSSSMLGPCFRLCHSCHPCMQKCSDGAGLSVLCYRRYPVSTRPYVAAMNILQTLLNPPLEVLWTVQLKTLDQCSPI